MLRLFQVFKMRSIATHVCLTSTTSSGAKGRINWCQTAGTRPAFAGIWCGPSCWFLHQWSIIELEFLSQFNLAGLFYCLTPLTRHHPLSPSFSLFAAPYRYATLHRSYYIHVPATRSRVCLCLFQHCSSAGKHRATIASYTFLHPCTVCWERIPAARQQLRPV